MNNGSVLMPKIPELSSAMLSEASSMHRAISAAVHVTTFDHTVHVTTSQYRATTLPRIPFYLAALTLAMLPSPPHGRLLLTTFSTF